MMMMFMMFRIAKIHHSLYFRQSTGCVWWTPLQFIQAATKKGMLATEKNYGLSWKCELPKNLQPQKNLGLWTAKLRPQDPALNLKTLILASWKLDSLWSLSKKGGFCQRWIQDLPKPAPISGCVNSEFAYNRHMMIVHYHMIIVWSSQDHHMITTSRCY